MAITSSDQAKPVKTQRTSPCHDCPMRRECAIPGWLGGSTPEEYLDLLHNDTLIMCHTEKGPQCAGAAIYRANTYKRVKDKRVLELPKSPSVFESPAEFLKYHLQNVGEWFKKRKCTSP